MQSTCESVSLKKYKRHNKFIERGSLSSEKVSDLQCILFNPISLSLNTHKAASHIDKQGANYAQRAAAVAPTASTQRTSRGDHQECDALTMTIVEEGAGEGNLEH